MFHLGQVFKLMYDCERHLGHHQFKNQPYLDPLIQDILPIDQDLDYLLWLFSLVENHQPIGLLSGAMAFVVSKLVYLNLFDLDCLMPRNLKY